MARRHQDTLDAQARNILIRWFENGKCHRIEQIFYDHPEFAQAVVDYYNDPKNHDTEYPTKLDVATHLLHAEVPGFAEAILALDAEKNHVRRVHNAAPKSWSAER